MKKSLFLIIMALSLTSFSQSIEYLDQLNGYKDLKFGTTKQELKSKIFDCTTTGFCIVIGDKYREIKNVKIENVYMTFNNQKLFSIILMLKGKENVDELLHLYEDTFGKATGRKKEKLEIYWEAKNVVLNFEIDIDKNNNISATVIIAEKNSLIKINKKEIQENLKAF